MSRQNVQWEDLPFGTFCNNIHGNLRKEFERYKWLYGQEDWDKLKAVMQTSTAREVFAYMTEHRQRAVVEEFRQICLKDVRMLRLCGRCN